MFSIAFRNLLRQRARSALTLGTIAFGVVGLVLSGGFVQDMFEQLAEAIVRSQTGHLQIAREGYFEGRLRALEASLIEAPERLEASVAAAVPQAVLAKRLNFAALASNGTADAPVMAEGVEAGTSATRGSALQLLEGRPLHDGDVYATNVGEGLARQLRLATGSRVNVLVASAGGAMNVLDFEVVGIFRSFSREYDARAVRVPLAAAQELLDTAGANLLVVSIGRTRDADRARDALRDRLRGQAISVRSWHELDDFYPKTVQLYERQFGVLRLIILIMVMLGVANTVNMSVNERLGEFATMRALGNRDRDVFRLVMTEAVVLGVGGAAIGVLAGAALAWAISVVGIPMPAPPNSNLGYVARIAVEPWLLFSSATTGVVATVLGAISPGLRVAREALAFSLRQNA